ncbi:STAS domain-containing protein [Oceanobacillus damuensis]|uniref:STAS domain-containing protein n=1 Tax=Oceanobacillus damuensis TaxID=937928 RepID=UPI0008335AB2|nr:STAS domain-containing protein [Oceanobacillus damuensis]
MSSLKSFSGYINKNAESIANEIVRDVVEGMKLDISEQEEEQAFNMYHNLFKFLGESLIGEKEEVIPVSMIEWSKKNSEMQIRSGGDLMEIIVRYPPSREIIIDLITRISEKLELSVKETAYIIKRINKMLDISLNETILTYKRLSDQVKAETQKEILKLSAPLVPIQDDIVILPLVGYIGQENAEHIMKNVIPKISDMEVDHVIADFSGTLTINIHIADFLHQTGRALSLMGIHVVFTGLRPDIVQTIVNSRIDFSNVETYATVKQAVENL